MRKKMKQFRHTLENESMSRISRRRAGGAGGGSARARDERGNADEIWKRTPEWHGEHGEDGETSENAEAAREEAGRLEHGVELVEAWCSGSDRVSRVSPRCSGSDRECSLSLSLSRESRPPAASSLRGLCESD